MGLNNRNFADVAEQVILSLQVEDRRGNKILKVTTSKIRNLLAMTNNIYNQAKKERGQEISEALQSDLQYLKMRIAYEAGRDKDVKDFVKKANLITYINSIQNNRDHVLLFCKYMESLVAYHKFHGGKDR